MDVRIQDLPFDAGSVKGLSEKLLRSHHQNNYGGAVKRLNAIRGQLRATTFASAPGFGLNGLKREELIATNSMLLHELYFACLDHPGGPMAPAMTLALGASFGSVERWRDEFVAMGKALGGGSGWVLLSFLAREGRLVNQCSADHSQALAGGVPILALDMYEHAYHLDFGAAAGAYVDAFMDIVGWAGVYRRYQEAVARASDGFGVAADDTAGAVLLDLRRAEVFGQSPVLIEGARWRDPAMVDEWVTELPPDATVVVYCVRGHEVSRAAALRLRASGLDARFLIGGLEAWQAQGRPVAAKPGR